MLLLGKYCENNFNCTQLGAGFQSPASFQIVSTPQSAHVDIELCDTRDDETTTTD